LSVGAKKKGKSEKRMNEGQGEGDEIRRGKRMDKRG